MIPHRAFVVADVPEPYHARIRDIRERLKTVTAKLPVEITLAGSSGAGPIPEGTDLDLIRDEVERLARSARAFRVEFAEVCDFPGTGVFFLRPKDRQPFDSLHASLTRSKIPFIPSPFPYTPHCSLRVGPKVEQSVAECIRATPVPCGEMVLDTISVYAVDGRTLAVSLLHRTKLAE